MSQMLELVGLPEYFTTELGEISDAGNGLVRVVCCIKRNSVLIPVFSQVIPAITILQSLPTVTNMVNRVLRGSDKPRH